MKDIGEIEKYSQKNVRIVYIKTLIFCLKIRSLDFNLNMCVICNENFDGF